ncbi:MAG: polysaccharide lyase family 8 super-sandwich domain-containing protein [Capsulimonadaceae bacterium]|nr:polysaccharide lyase family 8 super-sandwich domain-containing protein [Capsulimonadaceae bacterium]
MLNHLDFLRILPYLAASAALIVATAHPANAAEHAPDDVDTIAGRIVASLLPADAKGRTAAVRSGNSAAATLGPDGTWPDVDYADASRSIWKAAEHLSRLEAMAKACAVSKDDPASAGLHAKTLLALSWWLDHDLQNPNWWWNVIGTPMAIGHAMLLMQGETTPAQMDGALKILRRSELSMTGANLSWVATNTIMRGCLEHDPDTIGRAFTRLYQEIKIAGPGEEGIQADYSFHQHGVQLYSGGYGRGFESDCVHDALFAWGTRFQIPADRLAILTNYQLDGQQWMMRGARFDYSACGREITRPGRAEPEYGSKAPGAPLSNGVLGLASVDAPRKDELTAYAQRRACLSTAPQLSGTRAYWLSDYVAHQRPGYFASVKMCSTRIQNGEIVNGEGLESRYLSYGATFIYRTGNEYLNVFPVWDWRRIPGTTIEQDDSPLGHDVNVHGKTTFAGGASDGSFGVAAMDLNVGHVTGRKAWFFLDEGFIALGAGLTCTGQSSLVTTVNQCLLHGDVLTDASATPLAAGDHPLANCRWVLHDGIGYIFPATGTVTESNGSLSGKWSTIGTGSKKSLAADIFSLSIDHGSLATDASYAYGVLPGWTPSQLDETLRTIQVVANTKDVQAVFHDKANILEAAFWTPGSVAVSGKQISVDHACLLIVRRVNDNVLLTVASPEHYAGPVNVTLPWNLRGANATASARNTIVRVDLPGGLYAGQSVTATLNRQ